MTDASGSTGRLARRLGFGDAVAIGLGSMIGAGVFAVFAPASAVAGPALLIGLLIAAIVAYANASSSASGPIRSRTSSRSPAPNSATSKASLP